MPTTPKIKSVVCVSADMFTAAMQSRDPARKSDHREGTGNGRPNRRGHPSCVLWERIILGIEGGAVRGFMTMPRTEISA